LRKVNFSASSKRDLEDGVLRVESKVRADTITSIEQQIVLKKIGKVTKHKYGQIVTVIQRLKKGEGIGFVIQITLRNNQRS
jgi:mRNA-degrading endonuclease toxin of MazEF toxin-antitoxin module